MLELFLSPTINITSDTLASSILSDCLSEVALHIVSNTSILEYLLNTVLQAFQIVVLKVVCDTIATFWSLGIPCSMLDSSCALANTNTLSPTQWPIIPITSAWSLSPAISIV